MMTAWNVPVAESIVGTIILYAKIAACVLIVSAIIFVPRAETAITWKVATVAAVVKTAPQSVNHAEKIVASVMTICVPTAEYVTSARAGKEISAITAIYAAIARSCA